ncbi:DTW domain-containing protein [Microbulbifer sp. MLAF003]|nr:DTW domain-containing protein [Microbulbifer sp. MLAF003]WHI52425.1 DTW domain-containing protein [Microbulbifer sp. MLAF003]
MPRKTCDTCLRPQNACYCTALVKVANTIKVLIIQHPLEGSTHLIPGVWRIFASVTVR